MNIRDTPPPGDAGTPKPAKAKTPRLNWLQNRDLLVTWSKVIGPPILFVWLIVSRFWAEFFTALVLTLSIAAWVYLKKDLKKNVKPEWRQSFSDAYDVLIGFLILTVFGFYVSARAAMSVNSDHGVFTSLLSSLASLMGGAGLGFLFGVPKVVQEQRPRPAGRATEEPIIQSYVYQQRVNSNLEDISDWLTKIIVGIGLVELTKVLGHFQRAATSIGLAIGVPSDMIQGFGAGVIVFFGVVGFLSGYLLTRLFLSGALRRSENDSAPYPTASGSDRDADDFYTKDGIKRVIAGTAASGESVLDALLILKEPAQRTWLITTWRELIYIAENNPDAGKSDIVVQWKLALEKADPVKAKYIAELQSGFLTIGKRAPLPYSDELYPEPESLDSAIADLIKTGRSH